MEGGRLLLRGRACAEKRSTLWIASPKQRLAACHRPLAAWRPAWPPPPYRCPRHHRQRPDRPLIRLPCSSWPTRCRALCLRDEHVDDAESYASSVMKRAQQGGYSRRAELEASIGRRWFLISHFFAPRWSRPMLVDSTRKRLRSTTIEMNRLLHPSSRRCHRGLYDHLRLSHHR
jgi:hypothetical protein